MVETYFSPKIVWTKTFWEFLHTMSLYPLGFSSDISTVIEVIHSLHFMIPCSECKEHFTDFKRTNNLHNYYEIDNRLGIFRWTVDLHNYVNEKIGKPILSFDEALQIWASVPYC